MTFKEWWAGLDWRERPFGTASQIIAQKAWEAATKASVPEGWKLVPLEPTFEMRGSAQQAFIRADTDQLGAIYRAMVNAAPNHFP